MLVLKLALVPLFLFLVSMSGKWWGPAVAGWLAGLPVVAGPILFLLVVAHGPVFGAQAAIVSLSAILASEVFNFAYAWTCRSLHWSISLSVGIVAWFVAAVGLALLPATPTYAIGAAICAIALGHLFLPQSKVPLRSISLTRSDLVTRMVAGAVLTVFVTSLSSSVGAKWSGLLTVFPLIGIVLSVASHRAHGPEFVIPLLRGMVLGRFAFAAFCLCLTFTLPRQDPAIAFLEASVLAILVQGLTKRWIVQHRPRQK
ncbi:MAG: hypothetical protein ACRC6I_10400 [Paracoccaceae bacterium]